VLHTPVGDLGWPNWRLVAIESKGAGSGGDRALHRMFMGRRFPREYLPELGSVPIAFGYGAARLQWDYADFK
jgi:hypothetical protein